MSNDWQDLDHQYVNDILTDDLHIDVNKAELDNGNRYNFGAYLSIIVHIVLFVLLFYILNQDRYSRLTKEYRPTSTRGYIVGLALEHTQMIASENAPDFHKNLLDGAHINAKHADIFIHSRKQKVLPTNSTHSVSQQATGKFFKTPKQAYHTKVGGNQQALAKTSVYHKIIAPASSPVPTINQPGSGSQIDSSTDGSGTNAGVFDVRLIEYGEEAAYAINQNIVVPNGYQYVHVTYRAFVVLDHNMVFQNMQVVKSTGNKEYDKNIAKALRETIYPPLPPGASWSDFHNIDFTIH